MAAGSRLMQARWLTGMLTALALRTKERERERERKRERERERERNGELPLNNLLPFRVGAMIQKCHPHTHTHTHTYNKVAFTVKFLNESTMPMAVKLFGTQYSSF